MEECLHSDKFRNQKTAQNVGSDSLEEKVENSVKRHILLIGGHVG